MPSKVLIPLLAAASLAWLGAVCFLAERFNVPSADGILYSLPLAAATHPFDLGIPYLNDFGGYGTSWGHHWPGAMWLRGLIFFVLPYSRVGDVAVLSLFQWLTATSAAGAVWAATRKPWAAAAVWILILSDRLLLLANAGNRIESIAVAVVVSWFALSATGLDQRHSGWRWLVRTLAFLCPTLHPYGFVMGGVILGYDFLATRALTGSPRRECVTSLCAFLLGCGVVAAWFLTQPDAMRQFIANLALQKSFYQSWSSVIGGLGNYRVGGGPALWVAGLIASCLLAAGWAGGNKRPVAPISAAWRILAPGLFVTVTLIHTVTRCENFHYLAFGSPFAVMMLAVVAGGTSPGFLRWLSIPALAAITAMHGILIPYRFFQFKQAGMPDLGAEFSTVLEKIPPNRKVFIPHPFWPAAIADQQHEIRWFTVPIASTRETRQNYEREAYADAKPGDILIIENGGAGQADKFGLYPTFPTHPPATDQWIQIDNHKLLFPGTVPWGLDLSIYEFRKN